VRTTKFLQSCLAAAVLTVASGAQAQESSLDVSDLSSMSLEELLEVPVVTGSGRAEERSLAAANVFIVTREQITRGGYRSLAEILKRVPGIYVVDDHVVPAVGVREVTGGYRGGTRVIKIMVDGFPVNFRPDLETFIGPEFIPIEVIERVEVAKGPLSALYGANAFLATVNVITRKPDKPDVEVEARYRVVNSRWGAGASAVAMHGDAQKGLLLAVSTDRINRSGLEIEQTYENQNTPDELYAEPSRGDVARPLTAFGRVDYGNDKVGRFLLEAGYQELDSGAEYQINSLLTHRSRVNLFNQWLVLNYRHDFAKAAHARAYVGYSRGGTGSNYQLFLTNSNTSGYRPHVGYRAVNGLLEFGYDFADWLKVDIGVDTELRNEDVFYFSQVLYRSDAQRQPFDEINLIDSDQTRQHAYLQVGPYAQVHSAPIPGVSDFRVIGAVRGDFTKFGPVEYPFQPSYRGAIVYRFRPELSLKLIGGRAFQAPSGMLLFAHGGFGNNQNVVGSERLNNPEPLRPQVVSSAELVAMSQIGDVLTLEGSAYYQLLEDVIRFNRVASIIVAKNSGKEETAGAELTARLNLGRVRPYLSASGSKRLTTEITRDLERVTDVEGTSPAYPRFFGYAGADIEALPKRLFANVELRYAGPRGASQAHYYLNDSEGYDLPAYAELDVTLSTGPLEILSEEKGTRFLVSGRNLLGSKVFEPGYGGVDIPQAGTTFFAQVRQEL
jgi:outer membrane receptor protein involved in Fe transport